MPAANTTARLEARISTDLHAMLKRAAELQGRTMTDFVVAAVQDAAQRARRAVRPASHRAHIADLNHFPRAAVAIVAVWLRRIFPTVGSWKN